MPDAGHFVAVVGRYGSKADPEPFDINADLGKLPAPVVFSAWRHSSAETTLPPVGDGVVERIGNELVASGTLWTETPRGVETHAMLKRLGARARFSVAFVTLKTRPVNNEEREIGQSRVITRARLLEASPVLLPAEPSTRLLELKSSAMEVAAALKERREIARVNAEWQRFMTQMANREADRLFKRFNRIRRTA